ncbi:Prefoldin subunit 5 [Fasciola gigantica]|uniref:Prefoldin subunit 5 n=2 Tax=Fasciola TaxID=6191 RepID=A0A4E0RGB4_FASHE|nr:Prefoldin subunit 5 [Fasciola hepatica]TPP60905.1 Prefoldin subunit 5 [Fasciola gigantica]
MSGEAVNITDLSIPQLQELAKQYDQNIRFFTASIQQLKTLQKQFASSKNCLCDFAPATQNGDVLVPLTSTLCVPGKLTDTENVIVDIGTGYFSEMTIDQAEKHFTRRIEYINKHIQEIATVLEEKTQAHRIIASTLETKVQEFIRSRATTAGTGS